MIARYYRSTFLLCMKWGKRIVNLLLFATNQFVCSLRGKLPPRDFQTLNEKMASLKKNWKAKKLHCPDYVHKALRIWEIAYKGSLFPNFPGEVPGPGSKQRATRTDEWPSFLMHDARIKAGNFMLKILHYFSRVATAWLHKITNDFIYMLKSMSS